MGIKTFLIEETGKFYMALRRYKSSDRDNECPVHGYHTVQKPLEIMGTHEKGTSIGCEMDDYYRDIYKNQFPTHCDCGYAFREEDTYQIFREGQYVDHQGNFYTLQNAPAGAIWDAWWFKDVAEWRGPDGNSYICRLPNGHDWMIDSRASNCDSPCKTCGIPYKDHERYGKIGHGYEDARPHKCWVRHGEVPNLHVDKNGVTCGAGAGSISVKGWHGFLHNGELVIC